MTDTRYTRPQMGDELLSCPFCEGTHVVVCKNDMQHTAYCTDCEAEGPLALSQEDAITAWNRRASSQMGDEELRDVLNYVADMTYCGADAEWHLKPGYDPQRVLNSITPRTLSVLRECSCGSVNGEHVLPCPFAVEIPDD